MTKKGIDEKLITDKSLITIKSEENMEEFEKRVLKVINKYNLIQENINNINQKQSEENLIKSNINLLIKEIYYY